MLRLSRITDYLSQKSGMWIVGGCILLVLVLGVMDYLSGYVRSISAFYLIPVLIATWYRGIAAGYLTTLIAVLATTVSGILTPDLPEKYFTLYWNAIVKILFFTVVILILNAWRLERFYSRTDYLTGINNRYNFSEILHTELERCRRFNHPLSLVYMDVDNFKFINDRYGHKTGDELLKLVSKILTDNFRTVDTIARLGGDEFVILMPETASVEVERKIKLIHTSMLKAMESNHWPVTFSFGIAVFLNSAFNPDEMLKMSDALMYRAKQSGKNCVVTETYI